MPLFISPAGEEYEFPEPRDWTPAHFAFIESNKLRQTMDTKAELRDVGKSLISGGVEGIFRAPLFGADLAKLVMAGLNKVRPGTVSPETMDRTGSQPWLDAYRGSPQDESLKRGGLDLTYDPQTTPGRYAKTTASAVTGSAAAGGLAAVPGLAATSRAGLDAAKVALTPSSLGINAAGGLATEFGNDISGGNPLVGTMLGLGTVVAGNTGRNAIFRSNHPQQLHDAVKSMTPDDWRTARLSLDDFNAAGSKTFTLADLDRLQPRIGGIAQGMSNTTGGDPLRLRLSLQGRRNGDIDQIKERTLNGIGPAGDPRVLAEALERRGRTVIEQRKVPLEVARDAQLTGDVDPAQLLVATNRNVRSPRIRAENQGASSLRAYDAAESALLGPQALRAPMIGQVTPRTTNLRSIAENINDLRSQPATDVNYPKKGVHAAEAALEQATGGRYGQAMNQFNQSHEALVAPLERGLPGAMAGARTAEDLIDRLRTVPLDRLPGELNTLGVTPDEARLMARSLMERLRVLPDKARAGFNDTNDREMLSRLLDYADPALRAPTMRNLGVTDSLARLSAEHATDRVVGMHLSKNPVSTMVNPLGSVSMDARLGRSAKETQQISELLANPTPENFNKLRELAKVDPRAKRALEWISSLVGVGQANVPLIAPSGGSQ